MRKCLDKQGGVMVIVAISLLMFLALAALVVDLGQGLSVKTQLQEVADAAALAAASQLDGTIAGINNANDQANAYASKNKAAGSTVTLLPADIEFGSWDMSTKVFNPILSGGLGYPDGVNAVRITARRDAASGTALATTFAKSFGRNTLEVKTQAVAERAGPSQCVDSEDPTKDCNMIPIAVCKNMITQPTDGSPYCGVSITIGSTGTQSGVLTSFFDNSNTPNITQYIDGTKDSPTLFAKPCNSCPLGSQIQATQGVVTPILNALQTKYNSMVAPCVSSGSGSTCEDANHNGTYEWKAYSPVICADCNAPSGTSGPVCVTGFARINIEKVVTTGPSSSRGVFGFMKCGEKAPPNAGIGGGMFGTFSPIPGLVK